MLIENAIKYISCEVGYLGLWGEVKFSASAVARRCGAEASVKVGHQNSQGMCVWLPDLKFWAGFGFAFLRESVVKNRGKLGL